MLLIGVAGAHGVAGGDAAFIEASRGAQPGPYLYLGAKHMVTGYDHLLFLFGVIFFLHRLPDVGLYVTLFAIGHSSTLLLGVLANVRADAYLVDAVIGLSVAWKALDNLGAWRTWFGVQPDNRLAVFGFGLVHGFGLATKLQALGLSSDGLLANLVAFNVGVEVGQLLALSVILILMTAWRRKPAFASQAFAANSVLMTAGFVLFGYQIVGYLLVS